MDESRLCVGLGTEAGALQFLRRNFDFVFTRLFNDARGGAIPLRVLIDEPPKVELILHKTLLEPGVHYTFSLRFNLLLPIRQLYYAFGFGVLLNKAGALRLRVLGAGEHHCEVGVLEAAAAHVRAQAGAVLRV